MDPFWPNRETFLSRPRRVSRLFVVLFIFSATLNALLLVNYGYNQLAYQRVASGYESSITSTLKLAERYQKERDDARTSISQKNAELKSKTDQLASLTKQLETLNGQVKSQQSQLAANSSELDSLRGRPPLFSFQRNTSRDVSQDEIAVKEFVSQAYDVINDIYGAPYILHQITISFVDSLSIKGASGEITIKNSSQGIEITVKMVSFSKDSYQDVNTIVHEIIHGFHGLAAIDAPIMEEGVTVAATDEVLARLYQEGKISFNQPFVNISDEQAASLNNSLLTPPATNALYDDSRVLDYYQLAGWTWRQLYATNHDFFKKFNSALYKQVINGQKTTPASARSLISAVLGQINGEPSLNFINGQKVLNPS